MWDKHSMSWVPAPQPKEEEEEGESVMDEGEELSELGSVGGSSVGSLGLSGLSVSAPDGSADAEVTTPRPTLSLTPNRPGVCLRVRCGVVPRVTGLRLRVRRLSLRRAEREMPSALSPKKE